MRTSVASIFLLLTSSVAHAQEEYGNSTIAVDEGVFIQGHPYEITFQKKFLNTIRLVFDQDDLKKSWPYFGYKLNRIRDNLCSEASASRNLTVGKKIAFFRTPFDGSNLGSGNDTELKHDLAGLKFEFNENIGRNDISIRHVCDWMLNPTVLGSSVVSKIQALQTIPCEVSGSGTWTRSDRPNHAVPMMSGRLITDIRDGSYALLWGEVSEDGNAGNKKIAWKIEQDGGGSVPVSGGDLIAWKYTPDRAGASQGIEYYLTYPGDTGGQTDSGTDTTWQCPGGSQFRWNADYSVDDVANRRFSMWYASLTETPQTTMDDKWYLLIDGLLPTARADIRIERGVLE